MAEILPPSNQRIRELLGHRFDGVTFVHIGTTPITVKGTAAQRFTIYAARIHRGSPTFSVALALCTPSDVRSRALKDIPWTQLHLRTYNYPGELFNQFSTLDWDAIPEAQYLSYEPFKEKTTVTTKSGKIVKNPNYVKITDLPLDELQSDGAGRQVVYTTSDKSILVEVRAPDVDKDNLGGLDLPTSTTLLPTIEVFNTVIYFPGNLVDGLEKRVNNNIPRGLKDVSGTHVEFNYKK